jgi:hypothetical protein
VNRDGILGDLATYGGSVGSCASATVASATQNGESTILFYLTICSFVVALLGLAWSIWNGNRQFRLAQLELELKLKQQGDYLKASLPAGVTPPDGGINGATG